jgi:hypothetical protein
MSGSAQKFAIRLSLDGAEAVEGALRRVEQTAGQSAQAVERSGSALNRQFNLVSQGARIAGQAVQQMGGEVGRLAPVVESAGGAVGRLVTSLMSGGGLVGAVGAVGAAIGVVVTLYQNWETISRAVGTAVDFLTGRVRLNEAAINDANAALRSYLQLSETAAQSANRQFIARQREFGSAAEGRLPALEAEVRRLEGALATARQGGATSGIIARGGASGLVPTDEFGRRADQAVRDRLAQRNQAEAARLETELARARAAAEGQRRIIQGTEAAIAGAVQDQANVNPGALPPEAPAARPARGGGGGASARDANEALREREQIVQRNLSADEKYAQGLERIAALNDRLIAQGNDPLPDEVVQREAVRLMEEYERATRNAADRTDDLARANKELERAGQGAGKALLQAFEDLTLEGKSFSEVLKNLERNLLRLGNQYFLQPLFQNVMGSIFGGGGGAGGAVGGAGGAGGAGVAGWIGQAVQMIGSLFFHEGGVVGMGGRPAGPMPAALWAGAPRYHSGGMAGMIGPDEVPAILRRGETVRTPEQERALGRRGGVTVVFNGVTDAASFRASEQQITGKLARAIGRTGRNR